MADYAPFKRWNEGSTPSRSTNLRPHSLVEERQVLNLLAGVRFSLRPPFLAMSSSDKDAGLSSRLPGFDSRHRLHLRRVAGNGAQHFAKVRQRENVDGVRFPDSPPS